MSAPTLNEVGNMTFAPLSLRRLSKPFFLLLSGSKNVNFCVRIYVYRLKAPPQFLFINEYKIAFLYQKNQILSFCPCFAENMNV
jgi:hypothetical protein